MVLELDVKTYNHAPTHWFLDEQVYFITGAVYQKQCFLQDEKCKEIFVEKLFHFAREYQFELHEWAVLDNHYHILLYVRDSKALSGFINSLHKTSAYHITRLLDVQVRPFWYQYWDRCIRSEDHYFETAMYVIHNPIKHGLVDDLNQYPFSSFHSRKKEDEKQLRELYKKYNPKDVAYYDGIDVF